MTCEEMKGLRDENGSERLKYYAVFNVINLFLICVSAG